MTRIPIKPLSVNDAYRGRRFSTNEKDTYTDAIHLLARPMQIPDGPLEIRYRFGFKSRASDVDGPIKVLQDALGKRYGFNDNRVYRISAEKVVGEGEWIEFEIKQYEI